MSHRRHSRGGISQSREPTDEEHHLVECSPHISTHEASPVTHISGTGSSYDGLIGVYYIAKGQLDFTSSETSDAIRETMFAQITDFWSTFSDIPVDTQNLMFSEFMKIFFWLSTVSEQEIRKVWRRKASNKYCEWTYKMCSKKRHSSCPEEVYQKFMDYWESDAFKELSAKNATIRKTNPKLHTGGSRSAADYRNDLVAAGGSEPTTWQLYCMTHKVESGEGSVTSGWVDQAATEFASQYQAEIQKLKSHGVEITFDVEEQLFQSLVDKTAKRRDRRPNVGNIPSARIRDRASSQTQPSQGEEWKTRFETLGKSHEKLKNILKRHFLDDDLEDDGDDVVDGGTNGHE